jgi:hypothetical protein
MLIYAPTPLSSFPSLCPYSPKCVEGEFCAVGGQNPMAEDQTAGKRKAGAPLLGGGK